MKICSKCKENKPISEFPIRSKKDPTPRYMCKDCHKINSKRYYLENPEKIKQQYINGREAHKISVKKRRPKINQQAKEFRGRNKDRLKIEAKERYERDKEKVSEKGKEYRSKNKAKIDQYGLEYRKNNPEKVKEGRKEYSRNNRGKLNALTKKYKLTKKNATPPWLTKEQFKEIENFYIKAIEMEKETGIKYHVDHIVPLQGKTVCGLHVPWNLQILTAEENIKKKNKLIT